jgi:flagellar biosynthetic protein FliR
VLSYEAILPHAPVFIVVLSRVAGIFVLTPLLSSSVLPVRVRAMFALAMTVALYPLVAPGEMVGMEIDLVMLLPLVATEMLVGVCIGAIATIPLMSVQLGGLLMGQQMGLGMAQVVDPAMDIEGDNLGQILFIVAVGTFIMLGGLESLIAGLVVSFERVPAGEFGISDMPLDAYVGLVQSGFELAMRVSMPVLAIIFVENLAMGFLMKTVPSLNIMSFGFPVRILMGLFALLIGMTAMSQIIGDEVVYALVVMENWLTGLGGG